MGDVEAPPGLGSILGKLNQIQVKDGGEYEEEDEDYVEGEEKINDEQQIEENVANIYTQDLSFEELGIREDLSRALYAEMDFKKPSPIQARTLPIILNPPYPDLIAQAQNGSGKTTCFTLAMLQRVDPEIQKPQAICLCPTRELVVQNLEVLKRMGKYARNLSFTATSEDSYDTSNRGFKIVDQIIIGTIGRMKNWISRGTLESANVKVIVLDEADEMLSASGFQEDTTRLIRQIQQIKKRSAQKELQLILFSATFNDEVKDFASKMLPNAKRVFVPRDKLTLEAIKQYAVRLDSDDEKRNYLMECILANASKLGQTIIFVARRDKAKELREQLQNDGHACLVIEGGMTHEDRDSVIDQFRRAVVRILIATNVLSRGFDVSSVTLVINYMLPLTQDRKPDYETYLHRIGRTGRFGRKGAAFNFVSNKWDIQHLEDIKNYFKINMKKLDPYNEDEAIQALDDAGLK